jgi:glycosyltransferase involved in cell wall biosynthesis
MKAVQTTPAISVVLTTYNRAAVLSRTIASVLGQTFTDFELIIADDASPDDTQQVCQQWVLSDSRIRYHRRPENVGMPQNLNLGVLASTGRYVAILHDDDVYCPNLLSEWKTCLDEYSGAAFVFNAYRALNEQGETRAICREPLARCSLGSVLLENIFFTRWRFDSPVFGTVMIRRSAFDRVGPFDERYGFWADVDMWMRLAEEFDVCYLDEPLIAVTSRAVSPHQFDDRFSCVQPLMERMFWRARMRHYRGNQLLRAAEAARHVVYSIAFQGWTLTCIAKARMRNLVARRTRP